MHKLKKISIQSPTRVDLAGGTVDLWPLYLFVHGGKTVNLAIDIWTTAEIQEQEGHTVSIESADVQLNRTWQSLNELLVDPDPKLTLFKPLLKYFLPHLKTRNGFHLKSSSQSPVGGGLGGSSSLTISLMKAFAQYCDLHFKSAVEMVQVASNIEAEVLNTPTGTQDYFPAISGGINVLTYDYSGMHQEVLPIPQAVLDRFLLIYTGKAHHSGLNNFDVLKSAIQKDPKTLGALTEVRDIALSMENVCRQQRWNDIPNLFKAELAARLKLAESFSSPEIEKLTTISLQAGASAAKICGAGGGGCVLLWVEPDRQKQVREVCEKAGFQVLKATPVAPL